jgi:alpha-glucuronidase
MTWFAQLKRACLVLPGLVGFALAGACSDQSSGAGTGGATGSGAGTGAGASGGSGAGAGGSTANAGGTNPTGGSSGNTGGTNGGGGSGGSAGLGGSLGSEEPYPIPENLPAETGADLWLRYPKVPIPGRLAEYQAAFTQVVSEGGEASIQAASEELVLGLSGLTGNTVMAGTAVSAAGDVVIGTPETSPLIAALPFASELAALGPEGYIVRATDAGDIAVAANTEIGVLYGSFALLRHLTTHSKLEALSLSGSPKIKNRLLNHWDNLNGTVERGYAGNSLWWPGTPDRWKAYARANASIGINGTSITNVNADEAVLNRIADVKARADALRPYGIKVYLTAPFNAPQTLGGLGTSDPTNAGVRDWWADKADEIYAQIPDFGGFLIKANSEGQPGPLQYNKTHAEGANALAAAVEPHGGIVLWRAFVYSETNPADRITQAYDQFQPLDGQFDDNVLVQVKNGPLDFQPREPFSPLFGGMPGTPLALELQITKEYLGEDTHLAYLGPMWEEVLKADVKGDGAGSTVARVIDGSLESHSLTAISGVSNVGLDANWTGSHFNQANWYAYGRMAWDPDASAQTVAEEWVRQTFSNDPTFVAPVLGMMMGSHQTLVDYMTPLGLAHIMGDDQHYGPGPWLNSFGDHPEWNPVYYHKADAQGLGFNRTATGSNAVGQYASAVGSVFATRATIPDDFLLFFHHVGWNETLASGRTLWAELVHRYSAGVDGVQTMRDTWSPLSNRIDSQRFGEVTDFLEIQHYEARWWRDACLAYFTSVSQQPIPEGYAPLGNTLDYYKNLEKTCPADEHKPRCNSVYSGTPSPAVLP